MLLLTRWSASLPLRQATYRTRIALAAHGAAAGACGRTSLFSIMNSPILCSATPETARVGRWDMRWRLRRRSHRDNSLTAGTVHAAMRSEPWLERGALGSPPQRLRHGPRPVRRKPRKATHVSAIILFLAAAPAGLVYKQPD